MVGVVGLVVLAVLKRSMSLADISRSRFVTCSMLQKHQRNVVRGEKKGGGIPSVANNLIRASSPGTPSGVLGLSSGDALAEPHGPKNLVVSTLLGAARGALLILEGIGRDMPASAGQSEGPVGAFLNSFDSSPGIDTSSDSYQVGSKLGDYGVAVGSLFVGGAKKPKICCEGKQALVAMAKLDKRLGMTLADMEAYKALNKDLPDPFPEDMVRRPEAHGSGLPSSQRDHGHVGPVDHIPIN